MFATSAWHAAGRPWRIRQWRLGLARGGFVAFAQFCFYAALGHLAFATATTLAFAGSLIITALWCRCWASMSGRAGRRWCFCRGDPNHAAADVFSLYALLPLGAAFGYACSSVTVQRFIATCPAP